MSTPTSPARGTWDEPRTHHVVLRLVLCGGERGAAVGASSMLTDRNWDSSVWTHQPFFFSFRPNAIKTLRIWGENQPGRASKGFGGGCSRSPGSSASGTSTEQWRWREPVREWQDTVCVTIKWLAVRFIEGFESSLSLWLRRSTLKWINTFECSWIPLL